MTQTFDYDTAFQRNLGFLDRAEQQKLRNARVAIAGLGGTGGAQVHALVRSGIGGFNLADLDAFELANFNRQSGATMSTIGRPKVNVAAEQVRNINPDASIELFDTGIAEENIDAFLKNVDVVVDSLDFYCFEQRFLLYKNARERGLWVLTSPPLGFGYTLLVFDPEGMSFEDYFGFEEGMEEWDLVTSLVAGIAPTAFFVKYLHAENVSFRNHSLPSVGAAPFMIAGVIATEVINLIVGMRPTDPVPTVYQFDALLRTWRRRRYRMGMRSPLQWYKKKRIRKQLSS